MQSLALFLGLFSLASRIVALPVLPINSVASSMPRSDAASIKDALDNLKTEDPSTTSSVEAVQQSDYLFAGSWAKRDDSAVSAASSDAVAIKDALDALKADNPDTTSSVEAVQQSDYLFAGSWAKRDMVRPSAAASS